MYVLTFLFMYMYVIKQVFSEALIFSNLFKCRTLRRGNINLTYNLNAKIKKKCKYPFVSTIKDGMQYFGIPIFFFRLDFTSFIVQIPTAFVRWIPFVCEERSNKQNCCIGHIVMTDWVDVSKIQPQKYNDLSQFISFNDLLPSRYAMSYIPPTNMLAYYVQCAFIGLDSHQLGEEVDDNFHYQFGDNTIPHFKGSRSTNSKLYTDGKDEVDSDEENMTYLHEKDFERIVKFVPDTLVTYLTS